MSKGEIVFYDPHLKCQSYIHRNESIMRVCVNKGCKSVPTLSCVDCVESLHQKHVLLINDEYQFQEPLLTTENFVRETNLKYQEMQENSFKLEGQLMIFKKKNEQIKKMMNGELERLKNGMLKHIDTIKEVINLYMDNLDKKTTLMVNQKVERVNLSLKSLKPHRLGQLSQQQIMQLIENIWHSPNNQQIVNGKKKIEEFLLPLQEQLGNYIVDLKEESNNTFLKYRDMIKSWLGNEILDFEEDLQIILVGDNKVDRQCKQTKKEDEISKLLRQKNELKKLMEQHLIERNCTHKGCNELYEIRAFYGYYYHISQYTQFCELGLSRCAKAKKLNENMDYVVQRLYQMGYRENTERDYIWTYFIR